MLGAQGRLTEASSLVAQTDYDFLNKISKHVVEPLSVILQVEPENLAFPDNLPSDTAPASSITALEPNKEWVNAMVNGLDYDMTGDADKDKPTGIFFQRVSYIVDADGDLVVEGSGRVSSDPSNVTVALSVGEKNDDPLSSSGAKEGRVVCRRILVAPSLGKTDCRCVVVHPADPELPSFLSVGDYWYMFPLQHCCSSELFARNEEIAVTPLPALCQIFRVLTLPSHMCFIFMGWALRGALKFKRMAYEHAFASGLIRIIPTPEPSLIVSVLKYNRHALGVRVNSNKASHLV
ncbi:hypothetical protein Tco_1467197 [Tanacetum coccineum]